MILCRLQTKKAVKAKDSYSPVLERVKQNNMVKMQQENDTADPPPPGGKVLQMMNMTRVRNFINFKKLYTNRSPKFL